MARKPGKRASRQIESGGVRETIVAAFMALLAEKPFEDIGLAEIAARADISLAQLRDEFDSKIAILAAHIKEIDRAVLAGGDADMAEEPARERLFDVLMRRIEAMADDKAAVRSLLRSACRDPGLALALNRLAVNSQQWMLTAAGIAASGPKGMIRAQGLALMFAQVLRVWADDDDPGLSRTMAALDRELARGQQWAGLLDGLFRLAACPGRRRARRRGDRGEETAAA
jgi:AcrR family transcriptional regulator